MTIKIKNKKYQIKQTIRALFLFEQITDRAFEIKNTMDNYLYFYCLLLANNPDFMEWDEFLNEIDENPKILVDITQMIEKQTSFDKVLNGDSSEGEKDKKKV